MDIWTVNSPSTGPPHGGHVKLQLQQPMDGPFSVGSGRVPQQPPINGAPDQHQVNGFLSVGSGHFEAKPLQNHPPDEVLKHPGTASSPSQLSSGEMMIRCSQMMEQLLKQQLQLQLALSAMQSAMAAAPSSSIIETQHGAQQQVEVISTARCDQHPYQQCKSSEPRSIVTSSISTSRQISSQAPPSPKRAPAASEDGPLSAGEMIGDVTSDDHHSRKRFQSKPANPFSCQITEAPTSTTPKNGIPVDVMVQYRRQLVIRPALYAAYGAAKRKLDRQEQYSFLKSKVVASTNGSLQLHFFSRGLRPEQGKLSSFIGQLPPWPPPTPAFCSPTKTLSKIQGGREDLPAAQLNQQDVLRHRRFRAAAEAFPAFSTAVQTSAPRARPLHCSINHHPRQHQHLFRLHGC